jgi:hypothetical protein
MDTPEIALTVSLSEAVAAYWRAVLELCRAYDAIDANGASSQDKIEAAGRRVAETTAACDVAVRDAVQGGCSVEFTAKVAGIKPYQVRALVEGPS